MQTIHGVIRGISLSRRIFTVLVGRKIMYFYLTKSHQKKFGDYLQLGLFVSFNCSDKAKIQHRFKVYEVYNFIKLFKRAGRKTTVLFDISTVKKGVNKLINKEQYRLRIEYDEVKQEMSVNIKEPLYYVSITVKHNNLRTSDKEFMVWTHINGDSTGGHESQNGKIEDFTIGTSYPKGEYQNDIDCKKIMNKTCIF